MARADLGAPSAARVVDELNALVGGLAGRGLTPSGLRVRGNREFHDAGERQLLHPFHHPRGAQAGWCAMCVEEGQFAEVEVGETRDQNEYTFGALFLERD